MISVSTGTQQPNNAGSFEDRHRVIGETLSAGYDQLNKLWEATEKKLVKLLPPRHAWVSYRSYSDDDPQSSGKFHDCIGLIKYRGEWRICHGHYFDEQESAPDSWKPIVECSVEDRVAAVASVDKIREAILAAGAKSILQVKDAVALLAKAVEQF